MCRLHSVTISVAEHSLLVEEIARHIEPQLTADQCLGVLLHDAPEYVIGDMISPFKAVMGGSYKEIEERLQTAIHLSFGLKAALPGPLKKLTALFMEYDGKGGDFYLQPKEYYALHKALAA